MNMLKSAKTLAGSALALLIILTGTAVFGATHTVPGTFTSIAAANSAAAIGDTILVGNGIYLESFTVWKSLHFIASSGRPVIQYDGSTMQTIANWAGTEALINVAYGDEPTFTGFEFNGINGVDTCRNLFYSSYDVIFRDCIFHGTRGYLFRTNRAGSAFDSEFYGPASSGWRALWADSVVNCRFHNLPNAIGYAGSECTFINNVIYECTTAIYSRGARDNVYKNNLVYHCRNGYTTFSVYGDNDPSLRPKFINNTFVLNQRHGIRFSGKDNAVFKNNIIYWNGLEDTSIYYDLIAYNNNKPGWDITYNCIGRYSDSLDNTFADSINCIGNVFSAPLLADTAVGDTNNGFYLLVHSPAIDAGNQGIRDPDGSPSDMGCYGGPLGRMKAPAWLANLGDVAHSPAGASDNVTWPQYDTPSNFRAYMVYHDTTTTDMRYTVGPVNLVDSVAVITDTSGSYPHKDSTWYRISVAGDSTGYALGGGYTEMDTLFPRLLAAYYYSNGTRDISDDELRLVFNEGINEIGVDTRAPENYLRITGQGSFGDATISSVNEFVVDMGGTTAPGVNLALGQVVITSSDYSGTSGDNAVDDDTATIWSSDYADDEWIIVDLGVSHAIGTVELKWAAAYGSAYRIEVSQDTVNWTTVHSQVGGSGGTETISLGLIERGRYVRMYGLSRGTAQGFALQEIGIYGLTSEMFHHNRTWISVRPDSLEDYYGNAVVGSVEVTTFNVRNLDNNNDFETISLAVANATTDDFIEIYDDGYYYEQVDLNLKQITLQADSLANPVINGQGVRDYGVQVTADSVRVVGIRCDSAAVAGIAFSGTQGGWAVLDTCTASPAGILCINGCSDVVVRRSVAYGNADGIRAFNSTNTHVVNNISRDNTDDGIVCVNSASTEIRNNVCYANAGDGVETSGGGSGTVSNMAMLSNSVDLNNSAGYTAANNYTALTAAFTDTAANDFTLQQASPLWGAGENNENIGRYEGRVWRKGVAAKYHFINDAYGAAADDETLLVCPGRYYETLEIGKGVSIMADSGTGHMLVHSEYPYRNNRNDLQWNVYQTTAAVSFNLDGFIVDGENANVGNDNAGWGSNEHYGMYVLNGRISNVTLRNITLYGHNYIPYGIRTGSGGRVVIDSCRGENAGYFILAGNTHTARYCSFDSSASGLAVEGDRDTVRNCIFGPGNMLRMQADPDRNVIHNNLVNGGSIRYALTTGVQLPYGNKYINNTIIGDNSVMQIYGDHDTLINNIIIGDALALDVRDATRDNTYLYYNNITGTDAPKATATQWNMVGAAFEDPMFADSANGDFYLRWNSPMIDRGDLRICDPDDGRSDIGAYGGHAADTLAPARLDSFTTDLGVLGNNDNLVWDWNGSDPGDFKHYAIYRDTTGPNFQPDTSNLLDTITNVATKSGSYADNGKSWFYKISAVDTNLYGGGYALFDTVAPWIDTAIYYCNGTPGLGDDTLVVVMSEWIIDMTDSRFDSTFRVIGLGSGRNATISTGNRVNDDTLIVTGFDTILCRMRTRLDFSDTNVADYIRNLNGSSEINVTTYNVGVLRTGADYEMIGDAYAAAVAGDSIIVADAGLYPERLVLGKSVGIVGYGIEYPGTDSLPVLLDTGFALSAPTAQCSLAAACSLVNLQFVSKTETLDCIHVAHNHWVPHLIRGCRFNGTGTAQRGITNMSFEYRGALQIDSCEFFDFAGDAVMLRHMYVDTVKILDNSFHDITGGHGVFLWDGTNKVVSGNTFSNIVYNPGALRITSHTGVQIQDNTFYNCDGNEGLISLDYDADSIIIARNTAYNCGNDSGALQMKNTKNSFVFGNMFFNCKKGITQYENTWRADDTCHTNVIAFNTVANCTLGGISIKNKVNAPDRVIGNIVWGNEQFDLNNIGNALPVADYNWFTGGTNINWPRGPESDSGYPLFMDTTALDYRLQIASPCLNFTGYETPAMAALGIDTVDMYGTVRANPTRSYWDAGAYEGGGGPPRIDSVAYWACGTDSTGDDSMKVWFRRINISAVTVPTGAGQADAAFGIRGTGSIAGATIAVPGGDTNFVIIHMSNTDTVPSRLRDELILTGGVILSALDAAPAIADTDTVITWNVYNVSDDIGYRTIAEANWDAAMSAGDTIQIFDAGYYTDTLKSRFDFSLFNTGTRRPEIRWDGKYMNSPSWGNRLVLWITDNVYIRGVGLNGVNISSTDTTTATFIFMSNGTLENVTLQRAETYFGDINSIHSCRFAYCHLYYRGGDAQITGNVVEHSLNNGFAFYGGRRATVRNNIIRNCGGSGLYNRNAFDNIFENNLVYGNTGFALGQYTAGGDLSYRNTYRNNVFYNNGNGAYLDSAGAYENNIFYNNGSFEMRVATGAIALADSIRYNMLDSTNSRLGALLAHPGNVVTGIDPLFTDEAGGDFHLAVHSPAIDRGDTAAAAADYDGGRNDMGAYGGPTPIDTLHPHRLDTLAAFSVASTGYNSDTLSWPAYILDDYKFFAVYRGLNGDFVPAETNCIDSIFNIAALGARYANDGQAYVYKVSAVDSVDYGGGYQSATYARIFLAKTTHQTHTIPGDTMTYAVYYDNDGEVPTADTFEVVDGIPANTVYIDTLNGSPHTGGVIDVDWYDGAWQEDEPADPTTVQAIRWQVAPAIGAHADGGDASGADDGKTGIDTTGGDDAGTVYFRVRVR